MATTGWATTDLLQTAKGSYPLLDVAATEQMRHDSTIKNNYWKQQGFKPWEARSPQAQRAIHRLLHEEDGWQEPSATLSPRQDDGGQRAVKSPVIVLSPPAAPPSPHIRTADSPPAAQPCLQSQQTVLHDAQQRLRSPQSGSRTSSPRTGQAGALESRPASRYAQGRLAVAVDETAKYAAQHKAAAKNAKTTKGPQSAGGAKTPGAASAARTPRLSPRGSVGKPLLESTIADWDLLLEPNRVKMMQHLDTVTNIIRAATPPGALQPPAAPATHPHCYAPAALYSSAPVDAVFRAWPPSSEVYDDHRLLIDFDRDILPSMQTALMHPANNPMPAAPAVTPAPERGDLATPASYVSGSDTYGTRTPESTQEGAQSPLAQSRPGTQGSTRAAAVAVRPRSQQPGSVLTTKRSMGPVSPRSHTQQASDGVHRTKSGHLDAGGGPLLVARIPTHASMPGEGDANEADLDVIRVPSRVPPLRLPDRGQASGSAAAVSPRSKSQTDMQQLRSQGSLQRAAEPHVRSDTAADASDALLQQQGSAAGTDQATCMSPPRPSSRLSMHEDEDDSQPQPRSHSHSRSHSRAAAAGSSQDGTAAADSRQPFAIPPEASFAPATAADDDLAATAPQQAQPHDTHTAQSIGQEASFLVLAPPTGEASEAGPSAAAAAAATEADSGNAVLQRPGSVKRAADAAKGDADAAAASHSDATSTAQQGMVSVSHQQQGQGHTGPVDLDPRTQRSSSSRPGTAASGSAAYARSDSAGRSLSRGSSMAQRAAWPAVQLDESHMESPHSENHTTTQSDSPTNHNTNNHTMDSTYQAGVELYYGDAEEVDRASRTSVQNPVQTSGIDYTVARSVMAPMKTKEEAEEEWRQGQLLELEGGLSDPAARQATRDGNRAAKALSRMAGGTLSMAPLRPAAGSSAVTMIKTTHAKRTSTPSGPAPAPAPKPAQPKAAPSAPKPAPPPPVEKHSESGDYRHKKGVTEIGTVHMQDIWA